MVGNRESERVAALHVLCREITDPDEAVVPPAADLRIRIAEEVLPMSAVVVDAG